MLKIGRSSFKMGNWVQNQHPDLAHRWIEHNQRLFNREEVWLRVFKENAGWSPIPEGTGMFGSPPRDLGVWPPKWLQGHWNESKREELRVKPQHISSQNRTLTEWFFQASAETGCGFELCIIATLKHVDRVGNGHLDHIIRQELIMFDELQAKYPKAKVIANVCNEFDAHHVRRDPWNRRVSLSVHVVDMWAFRRGRDSYWSLGELIIDHGGRDTFDYKVNGAATTYDWGMLHPRRGGRDWTQAPNPIPLLRAANGQPLGATESMYYVDVEDTSRAEQWYRNRAGWQTDPLKQMELYMNLEAAGFTYLIVHDEKGAQSNPEWPRKETHLEALLREKYGGSVMGLKYERIIKQAYLEILDRPADPGGLKAYNGSMHQGLTEAQMRESLIRSREYSERNPEGG